MAASDAAKSSPVLLVYGEDDVAVTQRAREVFQKWSDELGGMDHETLDAAVGNASEAITAIGKLREALQTLPFFGGGKVVWFKNCSFLGDDRTAESRAVNDAVAELAQELKAFDWRGVRLIVSAGKVDKRKVFFKTLEKIGEVQAFGAWTEGSGWEDQAELAVVRALQSAKKQITDEAVDLLISFVGPNPTQLGTEVEKLIVYVGDRAEITATDVDTIATRNKTARAFAVGDAVGERNLPRVLRTLDSELWEMTFDREKSEIGLLYGLISKVRTMIFAKELARGGWVTGEFGDRDYNRFKAQLAKVPPNAVPEEKKLNPLAVNPFVLFRAYLHSRNYTPGELVRAMDLLLQCNLGLVSSGGDKTLALQRVLVQIVGRAEAAKATAR